MKKTISFLVMVFVISCASKKEEVTTDMITNKLSEEYSFQIKEILSDSRCPKEVTCVWAGEVKLILSVYKVGVFYKDEPMTVSFQNFTENKLLLEKYTSNKKIKSIEITPERQQDVKINLKDYSLKIEFE